MKACRQPEAVVERQIFDLRQGIAVCGNYEAGWMNSASSRCRSHVDVSAVFRPPAGDDAGVPGEVPVRRAVTISVLVEDFPDRLGLIVAMLEQ